MVHSSRWNEFSAFLRPCWVSASSKVIFLLLCLFNYGAPLVFQPMVLLAVNTFFQEAPWNGALFLTIACDTQNCLAGLHFTAEVLPHLSGIDHQSSWTVQSHCLLDHAGSAALTVLVWQTPVLSWGPALDSCKLCSSLQPSEIIGRHTVGLSQRHRSLSLG